MSLRTYLLYGTCCMYVCTREPDEGLKGRNTLEPGFEGNLETGQNIVHRTRWYWKVGRSPPLTVKLLSI